MPWFNFWRRKPAKAGSAPAAVAREVAGHTGGRYFMADVPYILPKDLDESNRLNFQHFMLKTFLKGNYLAPVKRPRDILDVGCGTGRWALDLAAEFPQANVIGVDVVPPAVDDSSVTSQADNYTFVQGNVLEQLPFADNSFDFVHQRYLTLAIPADRWPHVISELLRVTRPGGWIELIETAPPEGAPATNQLANWGKQLVARRGIDLAMAQQIGPLLTAGGAAAVTSRALTIPVGKPGGRIGSMMVVDYTSALTSVRSPLAALGIATAGEFDAVLAQAHQEFEQHAFPQGVYVAYGRKV